MSIVLNLEAAESIPDLRLLPEMINGLPPRISVDRVSPEYLSIRFEKIVTKPIRVRVDQKGEAGKGLELAGKIVIEPATVDATGIDSEVSAIQFAGAVPFDITGLSKGKHTRKLKLDDAPAGVLWSQTMVDATVELTRKMATREFSNIAVEVVGLAGAQTRPREVTLTVTGPPKQVEALRENAIVPRVEPRKSGETLTEPGSAEMPVIVDIPNVTVTVVPAKVIVKW
jgi:YbbR domain-containing protein